VDAFGLAQSPFNIASIVGMGWVEGLGLSSLAFIMIVATYRSMDPSLEEVGRVHGLKLFQTLRHITLPLTFPGILAAAIYIFTIGLSAFEVPAIIGMSNKIFTFSTFIFYKMQPLEELPNYGVAGAVSSLLVVLALLLSWCTSRCCASLPVTPWSPDALIVQNLSGSDGKDGFALGFFLVFFSSSPNCCHFFSSPGRRCSVISSRRL